MGWQAKAPAPQFSNVLSSNVGQALSPANSVIVAIFSQLLSLREPLPLTSLRFTTSARTNLPQVIERINPGVMTVAPFNPDRVMAHRLHIQHLEGRLEHWKCRGRSGIIAFLRLGAVRPGAGGARTFITQITQGI